MTTVLKNLVGGLSRQWTKLGKYWRVPNSASISEARQRVGSQVMSQLFERVVHPLATPETPGAFLGGLRVMAVDEIVLDVPDSRANARVFGYPSSRSGIRAAFVKVRLVLLIEALRVRQLPTEGNPFSGLSHYTANSLMNITGVTSLTEATIATLKASGAVELQGE